MIIRRNFTRSARVVQRLLRSVRSKTSPWFVARCIFIAMTMLFRLHRYTGDLSWVVCSKISFTRKCCPGPMRLENIVSLSKWFMAQRRGFSRARLYYLPNNQSTEIKWIQIPSTLNLCRWWQHTECCTLSTCYEIVNKCIGKLWCFRGPPCGSFKLRFDQVDFTHCNCIRHREWVPRVSIRLTCASCDKIGD